jgi:predicted RNase H-like HicB family nuclease
MRTPYYLVTDGELTLQLHPAEEGGYTVTCPWDPALITEADSLEEAFEMARDAQEALLESRKQGIAAPAASRRRKSQAATTASGTDTPVADLPETAPLIAPIEGVVKRPIRRRVIRASETVPMSRRKGK